MNRILLFVFAMVMLASCTQTGSENEYQTKTETDANGYVYEYVTNDPSKTRIYTLDNGLKVYLSVYKDEPRVQVLMPVKAGGAYDPADNTGLAHYLEHMMFKGTSKFGTKDWESESVLLDSIENMFNHYATLTDAGERKEYYSLIDQVSNEASKYAIANEFDKMMEMIGGKWVNAYTSDDETVYMVNIPANEMERYLKVESERIKMFTPRLFHTELETVYEEKNMSLDDDYDKAYTALQTNSFKTHPYGTQTVIGTVDHLKNPSITAIKEYFNKFYVPNNVAICMSGDLDPEATIQLIDKYFSGWEPRELEPLVFPEEEPITEVIETEVFGPEAEFLLMGFRTGGVTSADFPKLQMMDMMLSNSEAGLIDINLLQKQEVLDGVCYPWTFKDYSIHVFEGTPKEGQTLGEVRDLLLSQIEMIKKGEFEDWLMKAVVNDFKKSQMYELENNWARTGEMVESFTKGIAWEDMVTSIGELEKLTKEDIVAFANEYYKDNYVIVYKRNGEDESVAKVEKPEITKVELNRGSVSAFQEAIVEMPSNELSPVFVDYKNDVNSASMNVGIEVLSKQNSENELFSLYYLADVGSNNDPKLKLAVEYLEFLGTPEYSAEEFKKELYKLGCSFGVSAASDRTYVYLSGLDENMVPAMKLFESLLTNPQPDNEALENFIDRKLKAREDAKKSKDEILWSGLFNYGQYGPENSFTNVLSNDDLQNLTADELVAILKNITSMQHRILYYGPKASDQLIATLNENHIVPAELEPLPALVEFDRKPTDNPKVYWTHYDMVQSEIMFLAKLDTYDPQQAGSIQMFNQYYDSGMGSVIFQEIREARGLAYSAFGSIGQGPKKGKSNIMYGYVGTQADKQVEAMQAMMDLLRNMPESEQSFDLAKEAILSQLRSERITKSSVLWNYENAKRKGLDYDIRSTVYEQIQAMTLEDLVTFHETYLKDRDYITIMLGSRDNIDFNDLKKYGEVRELSLEELFGYSDIERVDLEMQ